MSTEISAQRLRKQQRHLGALLEQLLGLPAGLRGTFSRIYTRCGKPTCWCTHEPMGHPHTRITWSENGKLTTRKVPADQTQTVINLTNNYRRFRSLRRQRRAAQAEMAGWLDQYEQSIIDRSRRALKFLPPPPKMAPVATRRRRKTEPERKPTM